MIRPNDARVLTLCLLAAAVLSGCQNHTAPQTPAAAVTSDVQLDVCAEQLHDLCGQFLLYYQTNNKLPARLEDLANSGAGPGLALVCPVSRKAYVYDPTGVPVPGRDGWVILYDAQPCHAEGRWAIFIEPPEPGMALVARVIRPPESIFKPRRAVTAPQEP